MAKKDQPTSSALQINEKKFNALARKARAAYKDGRAIAGEIGAAVAEAVENDHLHKKAFAMFRSLDRLEPEKLADTLEAFAYYCDIGGLDKRAADVMRMPLEDDDAEDGEAGAGKKPRKPRKQKATGETEDPKPRAANVRPFPAPHGQAAE